MLVKPVSPTLVASKLLIREVFEDCAPDVVGWGELFELVLVLAAVDVLPVELVSEPIKA